MTKCLEEVKRNPKLRREIVKLIEEEAQDTLGKVIINSFKKAAERPPTWWIWFSIMLMGFLGGLGTGLFMAYQGGVAP
ncbi:hypothetical protein [Clavavirus yamagawaense]|uniref:Uncharacterized protein n=1 Tax=Aeropyrum pernix bacilliform virus 1 (isolate -/Japan/Tanaka/2005) TaxID=1289471 RepID=D4QF78_APBV1|nr:hypothetical protein FK791_gp12 [Aeropyrum pernix bacilliform virus 1]BAJ06122.1 hypothetical protein [Aeropyrum pernix bacilliform virus 1]